MSVSEWVTTLFLLAGAFFFFAGTLGLLRFPDVYNRLHALTKADNVGLGLITIGLMLRVDNGVIALKLLLIWFLVLLTSATAAHLIANAALRGGLPLWRRP